MNLASLPPALRATAAAQVAAHRPSSHPRATPAVVLPPRVVGPDGWRDRWVRETTAPGPFTTEHAMQCALMEWVLEQCADLPDLAMLFAVPNGGHRDARTGARLKAEGVRKGIVDLLLLVPRGGYHGAALELKLPSNRPSRDQQCWLDAWEALGYRVACCRSLASAQEFLEGYCRL